MLFEIDKSCLEVLKTNDFNAIAFFEQLALDRRKCRNIVVAKREIFFELAKNESLSDLSRAIYNILGNRMSERKLLLKNTKRYCRIVATNSEKNIIIEDNHEIILLNILYGAKRDFTGCPIMLAENEEDIEFYKFVGKYFVKKNKIGNINIDFEEKNGGGSTISNVLERVICEKQKMCLCIVDSDRKYGEADYGDTMKRVISVTKDVAQDYFEVLLLQVHEIENIIPFSILENIVKENRLDEQGLLFIKFLTDCDDTMKSPAFYFDLKKGISKSAFVLADNADYDQKRKYRKNELYRQYWRKYIDEYGIKLDDESNQVLVGGVCEKVLRYALQYLRKMECCNKLELLEIEKVLQQMWEEIGEKVYCWGCIGGRIAV